MRLKLMFLLLILSVILIGCSNTNPDVENAKEEAIEDNEVKKGECEFWRTF